MNLSLSDHEDSYSAYSDDFENESQASHRLVRCSSLYAANRDLSTVR